MMNRLPSIAEATNSCNINNASPTIPRFPQQPLYTHINFPPPYYLPPPHPQPNHVAYPNSTGSYMYGQPYFHAADSSSQQLIGKKRSIQVLRTNAEEEEAEVVSSTPTWTPQGQTQHFPTIPPPMFPPSQHLQPVTRDSVQYAYPHTMYPYFPPVQHSTLQHSTMVTSTIPSATSPISSAESYQEMIPRSKTSSINTNPSKKLKVDEKLIKQSLIASEKGNEATPLAKYYSNFIQQGTTVCKEERVIDSKQSTSVEQAPNLLSLEQIAKYFENTEHEASQQLNVSTTKLKLICRGLQIYKWPYRKLKSLQKRIDQLETLLPKLSNEKSNEVMVTHTMVRTRLLSSNSDDTGSLSLLKKCIEYLKDLKSYICKVPKLLVEYSSEELLIAYYCDVIVPQQQKPVKLEIKSEEASPLVCIKQESSSPVTAKPESKPLKSFRLSEINKEDEKV